MGHSYYKCKRAFIQLHIKLSDRELGVENILPLCCFTVPLRVIYPGSSVDHAHMHGR